MPGQKASVSPVVVTPGESSAFTRALLEKEEDASSSSLGARFRRGTVSVASFVTTGSSFRAAGSAHGGDDADEYIAAMEVINKHDCPVSARAAAAGVTPRASEDGDRDRDTVGDDDGSDSDEEAVSEASRGRLRRMTTRRSCRLRLAGAAAREPILLAVGYPQAVHGQGPVPHLHARQHQPALAAAQGGGF